MLSSRCSTCPKKYNLVLGDGPVPSRVMIIGEAPGREEDGVGRPFIGQAGREFNENYLSLAGLRRDEVFVSNSVKCRPDLNRKPGQKELWGCANHHIPGELDEVSPEVVILLGATACSLVPEIDLEVEHGIPSKRRLYNWEGWVVPMFHPAAGLHQTEMMIPMLEDWSMLSEWLAREEENEWYQWSVWPWAQDQYPTRDYALVLSSIDIDTSVPFARISGYGFDTETHMGSPYSFQYSAYPGTGRMVLLESTVMVDKVVGFINSTFKTTYDKGRKRMAEPQYIAMHSASADLDIANRIGLKGYRLRDTQQECYQFQNNYRQGLKALSRRHLGRVRKSWDEVVTPHSKVVLQDWLMSAWGYAESSWTEVIQQVSKTTGKSIKPKVVVSKVASALKSIYFHTLDGDEYDGWAKVRERVGEVELMMLEAVEGVGSMPGKGIAHVPIAEAVEYGCSDADDTLALAILFDRMRGELVSELNVQVEDVDA